MKRLRLSLSVLTLVSLWSLTATRTQAASLPTCTSSITACCEITAAGTYVVTSPLTSTDPAADCIDINAANVNLFDAGNAITGPGSGATGVGINVLKKAKNAAVLLADPSPNSTPLRRRSAVSGRESRSLPTPPWEPSLPTTT